ncbi:MAG: response regulator [Desulfovibrionales bacterium]
MATTILLVDDEKAFVDALSERLERRDLDVIAAYSGREALQKLGENNSIDIVILDVSMPEMDGITALKEIKKEFPLVEVVMLTGHATVKSAINGMKLGAIDYLMKPCDIDQLMEKIKEAKSKKDRHEQKIIDAHMKEIISRKSWD